MQLETPPVSDLETLPRDIEKLYDARPEMYTQEDQRLFQRFKTALNLGLIRAAEPDSSTRSGWRVNAWVKKGILIGFRMGVIIDMSIDRTRMPWLDKDTYPVKQFGTSEQIRIVPGGSSVRDGCFISRRVTCMPPSYINVGAWVGESTIIDSHALVGSCAQVGAHCHNS